MPKAVVIPIAVMLLALGAATAYGASSRAEYVAQADPICQAGSAQEHAAVKSYVKSVKRYDKHHHGDPYRPSKKAIRLVVRHYSRVLAIERSMNSQLSSISAAPGDEAAVNKWLQLRSQAADLLERTIHAVHHRKVKLSIRLYLKSLRRTLLAQIPISDFGFRYCSRTPADF
jgi:hypothetical protein